MKQIQQQRTEEEERRLRDKLKYEKKMEEERAREREILKKRMAAEQAKKETRDKDQKEMRRIKEQSKTPSEDTLGQEEHLQSTKPAQNVSDEELLEGAEKSSKHINDMPKNNISDPLHDKSYVEDKKENNIDLKKGVPIYQTDDIAKLDIDLKPDEALQKHAGDDLPNNDPSFVNPEENNQRIVNEAPENFQPSVLIKRQSKGMF